MEPLMHAGTPFRAVSLLAADDDNFVVPDTTIQHPASIAGNQWTSTYGLVITGVYFSFYASGTGVGFTLNAEDYSTTPTGVNDVIYRCLAGAAGHITQEINCFWPLRPGNARSTPYNPSKIKLDVSGTAPTNGILVVQGFQTSEDYGKFAITSSPVVY